MPPKDNHETAASYLKRARDMLEKEALTAHQRADHNLCVRRCQEVVELTLKGLFKAIGIEYPKAHDVGPVLARELPKKRPGVPPPEIERVMSISAGLARKRGPSFYNEETYSSEDAQTALGDAAFVLNWVNSLLPA